MFPTIIHNGTIFYEPADIHETIGPAEVGGYRLDPAIGNDAAQWFHI